MNRSRITGDLVSQNNIFVDIANDRVGIGSTIPGQKLSLPDSAAISLGDSADLRISFDGGNAVIRDHTGNGSMRIANNNQQIQIEPVFGQFSGIFKPAEVMLFHSNALKFQTTAYGINVTGTTDTDGLVVSGVTTSTGTLNSTGGIILTGNMSVASDTAKVFFGASNDLSIYHNGSHSFIDDTGTGNLKLRSNNFRVSNADESKMSATFVPSGAAELYHNNAKKFETTAYGIDVTGTTGTDGLTISGVTTFSASDTPGLQFTNATFGTKLYIGGYTGGTNSSNISRIRTSTGNLHIDSASNGGLYLNHYSTGTVYVRGNRVLTTADEGSGNGLDADTLDGQQGSYYADAASYVKEIRTDDDITSRMDSGFYETSSATTAEGWPETTNSYMHLIASTHSNTANYHSLQIASPFSGQTKFYIRSTGNSGTQAWSKIWTSSSDGSGSGLDADTVDGIQGGSFLRGDVDDTTVAHLTFNRSNDAKFSLSGSNDPFFIFNEGTTQKARIQWSSSGYLWIQNHEDNSVIVLRDNIGFSPDAGSTIHKIWHAGNDGTGSGLDADTLDGVQGSSFLRSDANDTSSGTVAFGAGTLDPDSFASFSGGFGGISDGSGWGARGVFVHGGGTGDAAAMAHNGGALYFGIQDGVNANSMETWLQVTPGTRVINFSTDNNTNNVQIGGSKIWHSGNDGGGSGLDADTVDGIQGANLLRSDTADTASGDITFNGGAGAIRIAADSDIRFTNSPNWTGESPGKLQFHSDKWYWQASTDGWQFRDSSGTATLELSPAGVITGKDLSFSSEIKANHGAGALRIEANSDIRFTTGNWTGENSGKIQYHNNKFYWQTGANGWQFRDSGGTATLELSPAGAISGKALTFGQDCQFTGGASAVSIAGNSDIRFTNGNWTGNSGTTGKIQMHNNTLYIAGGSNGIMFREDGTDRWQIEGSGHFTPESDSTYDIGTSSVRVRNGYFDTLYGDGSNLTGIVGVTINNNTNDRVATCTGTTGTLNGEANLQFNGSRLLIQHGTNSAVTCALRLSNPGEGSGSGTEIEFFNGNGSNTGAGVMGRIKTVDVGSYDADMRFEVSNKGSTSTATVEAARLTKDRNLVVQGTITAGDGTGEPFYKNVTAVTANTTIDTSYNWMSAGPITINSGVTVTVNSGATWTVV